MATFACCTKAGEEMTAAQGKHHWSTPAGCGLGEGGVEKAGGPGGSAAGMKSKQAYVLNMKIKSKCGK